MNEEVKKFMKKDEKICKARKQKYQTPAEKVEKIKTTFEVNSNSDAW